MITEIKIKGVKGISEKVFKKRIYPNKPTLFVAPNGFGKSSLAIAFASLKRTGIDLEDKDKHNRSEDSDPEISLKFEDDSVLTATSDSNEIANKFYTFVINSQLDSKATTRKIHGFASSTSSLYIKPITLVNTIPDKKVLNYGYREMKRKFNNFSKLFINFTSLLEDESVILEFDKMRGDFKKMLRQIRSAKIDKFINYLNTFSGTKKELKLKIDDFSLVEEDEVIQNIIDFLTIIYSESSQLNETEKYINVIQLIEIYKENKDDLTEIVKYHKYIDNKKSFEEKLNSFDTTWKEISTKETNGKLVLELPSAEEISNGERDILSFLGKIYEARRKMRKDKCILIIDEIFDYLDDGNLIAAQYFINDLISHFKEQGKDLYPIILTHRDPQYFRTYQFKLKNVHYLDKNVDNVNLFNINELLKKRGMLVKNKENKLAKYFLHYHPDNICMEDTLKDIGVDPILYDSQKFKEIAFEELEKYNKNEGNDSYDIPLVCSGLRIKIEETIYNKLNFDNKDEFLDIHRTNNKLEFASDKGINIPEIYFLLSIIYNDALHMDSQCKKLTPIGIKLRHPVIRKMISKVEEY